MSQPLHSPPFETKCGWKLFLPVKKLDLEGEVEIREDPAHVLPLGHRARFIRLTETALSNSAKEILLTAVLAANKVILS